MSAERRPDIRRGDLQPAESLWTPEELLYDKSAAAITVYKTTIQGLTQDGSQALDAHAIRDARPVLDQLTRLEGALLDWRDDPEQFASATETEGDEQERRVSVHFWPRGARLPKVASRPQRQLNFTVELRPPRNVDDELYSLSLRGRDPEQVVYNLDRRNRQRNSRLESIIRINTNLVYTDKGQQRMRPQAGVEFVWTGRHNSVRVDGLSYVGHAAHRATLGDKTLQVAEFEGIGRGIMKYAARG